MPSSAGDPKNKKTKKKVSSSSDRLSAFVSASGPFNPQDVSKDEKIENRLTVPLSRVSVVMRVSRLSEPVGRRWGYNKYRYYCENQPIIYVDCFNVLIKTRALSLLSRRFREVIHQSLVEFKIHYP